MKNIYIDHHKDMRLGGNTNCIHLYRHTLKWHCDIMVKWEYDRKYISYGIFLRKFV